jgi:hypothetical protein
VRVAHSANLAAEGCQGCHALSARLTGCQAGDATTWQSLSNPLRLTSVDLIKLGANLVPGSPQPMPSLAPARAHADARPMRSDARPGRTRAAAWASWPGSSAPRRQAGGAGEGGCHRDERATGAGAAARPGPGPYAGSVPPPGIPPRHGLACHPHHCTKFLQF